MNSDISDNNMSVNSTETKIRIGVDLDDTVFEREWYIRLGGAVEGRLRRYFLPNYTPNNLPDIDHTLIDRPFKNWRERISFNFHSRRKPIPGAVKILKELKDQGVEIYAISGRHATQKWHEMTRCQLDAAGLSFISNIILKPDKVSTAVSKAHAISAHEIAEFYDDDLKTLFFLSHVFRDKKFHLIKHRVTNVPMEEEMFATRPNLAVIKLAGWR